MSRHADRVSQATVPPDHRVMQGYGYAGLIVVLWAGFSLAARFSARNGGPAGLTPWDLGALRYTLAFIIASGLWAAGRGRGLPWRRSFVLAMLAGFGFALPSYAGFRFAPAAHGALILSGALPFLIAAMNTLVLRERWTGTSWLSLLLLAAGFILVGTEAYAHGNAPAGAWRGDLLFLVAATCWALYTVLARRWQPGPLQSIVAIGLWCGPLFLPVWWMLLPSHLTAAPWDEVAFQAFYQGIVAVVVSLWLFTRALAILGPSRLAAITALVPGTAALLAVPLLNEPLGTLTVLGLVAVCAAVAVGARA